MTLTAQTEAKSAIRSFLAFKLMEESFAIDVVKVIEILELTKITKVPKSPDFLLGVINLRGNVLPVIDARVKFGMPKKEFTVDSCIIVMSIEIDGESITLGALVDSVNEVLEISEDKIQAPPTIGSRYNAEFMEGLTKLDDEFIMILRIERAFSASEADQLNLLTENKSQKRSEKK